VHTNGDLDVSGNAFEIAEDASSSGTNSLSDGNGNVGGTVRRNQALVSIPAVNAEDYEDTVTWVLTAGGLVQNPSGTTVCDASGVSDNCVAVYGFEFNGAAGWETDGNTASGMYYVQSDVTISTGTTITASIFATGSIDLGSNSTITASPLAAAAGIALLANGDFQTTGNSDVIGAIMVREQIEIGGNVDVTGQIIAEGRTNVATLVTSNRIHGNVTITYDGANSVADFGLGGWREVR
jgi:NDP-sugar pyrophosphorylase family protein